MKRVLILMANGVESLELATFSDVLGWANKYGDTPIEVRRASTGLCVNCACGMRIEPDLLLGDVRPEEYDALAIPGGFETAGYYEDAYSESFLNLIRDFDTEGKPIASICVGALPIAKAGVLVGREATTYHLDDGKRLRELAELGAEVVDPGLIGSVIHKNIITCSCPAYAFRSALNLLGLITSSENVTKISQLMGFR